MAKSKKVNKDVSENVTDTVSYQGIVKVTLSKNGKKISSKIMHNTGTQLMFEGIVYALIQKRNNELLPNFIGVGKSSDTIIEGSFKLKDEIIRVPITYTATQEGETQGYYAIFGATIPYNNVADTIIREIGLYGTSTSNSLLARFSLSEEDKIEVSKGLSISIEWKVLIKNGN